MALHSIIPGRCNLPSLLLTLLLYLGAYRIVAQSAPVDVTNVNINTVNETSFIVTWTNSTSANITNYKVIVNNGTDVKNELDNASPYTASGLLPGVSYKVTIYTITSNGTSPGTSKNVTTLPSSVSTFQVTAVWTNQMNLSWTAPNDVNKNTYNYSINRQPGNTNYTTSNSFIVITGLSPGTNYTFTIFTVTQDSVKSQKSQLTTNTTKPSVVTGLIVTSRSVNSVTLQWTSSPDPNSSNYTYNVEGGPTKQTGIKTNTTEIKSLAAGTDYNFTVFAVTSNGVSSAASNVTSTTTLPSSVSTFQVTAVWTDQMNLSWTVPTDASKNTYHYSINRQPGNTNDSTSNSFIVITGLSPGTNYTFTIFTVTKNGVLSQLSQQTTNTTKPSVVTDLIVTSRSETSVTLQWTSSTDPNSSNYTYTVEGGPTKRTGITTNTVEIKSLAPGMDYNFTVFAVTPNGVSSEASNVASATTQPSPVTGLNVSSVSNSSVTLTWTLSTDTNSGSYNYTVNYGSKNITDIKANTAEIKGLDPGTEYNLTVYAVTKNGISSNPSNVTKATTQPNIVQGVNVTNVSETTVTLQWDFSMDPNSITYTYTVDGKGNNFTKITNISKNSVVIPNLLPGVDYSLTVSAVTTNGVSSDSSTTVYTTTMPSTVPKFGISGKSNDSVNLNWTFPSDINYLTYKYIVEVNGSSQNETSNNSLEIKNLLAGQTYSFTIYTITKNDIKSRKYQSIEGTTQPNAPNKLQGNAVNISEIYLTWAQPADVNVNLYDYHVTWQDTMASLKETTSDTTKDTHFSIKNLLAGHLYNIVVTSIIRNTESVNAQIFAATKSVTTQSLAVGDISNTSVTLTWQTPNTTDGVVSGYRVTVYVNGDKKMENETSAEKYVVNNLEPGNVYNITVESFSRNPKPTNTNRVARADNTITSYSEPKYIKVETQPDPVSGLKCSKVDAYQIRVFFECPVGNFSSFDVLVNENRKNNSTKCPNDVVVSNLQPAASYKISVKTVATEKAVISGIIICETDNTGVIVGSIFGVLLFLLLIAVIAFFVLKKRRSKSSEDNVPSQGLQARRYHTIPKNNFKQHYEKNHADSDFGFADEYQSLSAVGTSQPKRAADIPENRVKNRFTNVLPYDHSRVKLSAINGTPTSDYVNANYMPGYNSSKEFIASQGPLPNTTADFWRMVWENQVNTIVMLTNCIENGRVKCEHYWPLDYTPCTYGDIAVTVMNETILPEWTIRDFEIRRDNQPGIKKVRHFHFTAWPDHGVPESTASIIQFRNLVREHMDQHRSNGPTVVHCSAGVGRTGTLIAIDYLIQQIEKEQRVGVYGYVEKMRMSRNLMVQTEAQYVFLNKCILDLIDQPVSDPIYENHTGNELVYENLSAIRNHQRENV